MAQSPTSEKSFILVDESESSNGDALSLKSIGIIIDETESHSNGNGRSVKSDRSSCSSYSDVLAPDFEAKLGISGDENDVPALVAEAQHDVDTFNQATVGVHIRTNSLPAGKSPRNSVTQLLSEGSNDDVLSEDEVDRLKRRTVSDGSLDGAYVFFHGITYLGSAKVNAPVSEIELKRAIGIMRENTDQSINIVLAVGEGSNSKIRLIDPDKRTDIAIYNAEHICYWGKGDTGTIEADSFGFNILRGEGAYHCLVFRCSEEDAVTKVVQHIAESYKRVKKAGQLELPGEQKIGLDPNNLTFKFDVTLDIYEEAGKGTYTAVSRDRSNFKLRKDTQKKIFLCLEQTSNRMLTLERCFGLLLCPGRNARNTDMHLLDGVHVEVRGDKVYILSSSWDPTIPEMKVLNTETTKETRVFMTIVADLIFSEIKEPIRIVKETKVKIFPFNEKFWNPTKPRMHEEFVLQLKEEFTASGDKMFIVDSFLSSAELNRIKSHGSKNSPDKSLRPRLLGSDSREVDDDEDDDDSDEALVSGTGHVNKDCSAEELEDWAEILKKWKDVQTRPNKLVQLVRKGVPEPLRGQVWLMLCSLEEEPELINTYCYLVKKDSPAEQVILWDVTRTFPTHNYFKQTGGEGQEALYRISKAYSVYDEEVSYCQGFSFFIAVLLLHMPEEQAFCVLCKLMFDYGHRELFRNGFEKLHEHFFVLERIMEDLLPGLHNHFIAINVETHMFSSQWFLTLFTAKFPLPLVFQLLDIILCEGISVLYNIAYGLLKSAKKELLGSDFEGVMKYFRVYLPKQFLTEERCDALIATSFNGKVTNKKIQKYVKECEQFKKELAEQEDPVEGLKRENRRLYEENMRLEQENDSLAHEVVITKVSMQETITELEERINVLIIDQEKMKLRLYDGDEEIYRLKEEEIKMKHMWRQSVSDADKERSKQERIIDDYKKICTKLEERNENFRSEVEKELNEIREKTSNCPECKLLWDSNLKDGSEAQHGDESKRNILRSSLLIVDQEGQMRSLEAQLIETKLLLAESQDRCGHLDLRLQEVTAAAEKPWYKKLPNKR